MQGVGARAQVGAAGDGGVLRATGGGAVSGGAQSGVNLRVAR